MSDLTPEQKAYNNVTWEHIHRVQHYMLVAATELLERAHVHDQSKLRSPEVEGFANAETPALAGITYDSEEYLASKKLLKPALDHHYANNRHHPEHFKNGIADMNLIDIMEMFCDWMASSERHHDGNIRKSIENHVPRFDLTPQLRRIFENTVDTLRK